MTSDFPLSFVLLSKAVHADPAQILTKAAELGVELAYEMGEPTELTFRIATGGTLIVALMSFPHPDAVDVPGGPTSPDPSVIQDHEAHYVITTLGMPDGPVPSEVAMGIFATAVIRSTPAVAAMLGHGVIFHRADIFAGVVEASGLETPTEITVDVTAAQEDADRMSLLTHGLERYGREEFYVTSSISGSGALDYVMGLVRWMIADRDMELPTGDTVGRTADERIEVQRVPSPIPGKPDVIRLDLDTDTSQHPQPKRRTRWFRRER